jgi:hypothetical protein
MSNEEKPILYTGSELESGRYYRINGTKKRLYWNGLRWLKPVKDTRGQYSGWIGELEKQPKVKYVQEITISDLY